MDSGANGPHGSPRRLANGARPLRSACSLRLSRLFVTDRGPRPQVEWRAVVACSRGPRALGREQTSLAVAVTKGPFVRLRPLDRRAAAGRNAVRSCDVALTSKVDAVSPAPGAVVRARPVRATRHT